MRCLKCKKEISDELIRCNYCNTKVQTVCPVCGAKNLITEEFCKGCGLQLLKYCPECKSVNLPSAKKCRKCSADFDVEDGISISDLKNNFVEQREQKEVSSVAEQQSVPVVETPVECGNEDEIKPDFSKVKFNNEETHFTLQQISEFTYCDTEEESDSSEPEADDFEVVELSENEYEYLNDNDVIYDEPQEQVVEDNDETEEDFIDEDEILPELVDEDIVCDSDIITESIDEVEIEEVVETDADDIKPEVAENIDSTEDFDDIINDFQDDEIVSETERISAQEDEIAGILTDEVLVEDIEEESISEPVEKLEIEQSTETQDVADENVENSYSDLNDLFDTEDDSTEEISDNKVAEDIIEEDIEDDENQSGIDENNSAEVNEENKEIEIKAFDQMRCKNHIVKSVQDPDKYIIGLSSPEGYGKSTVLKYLFNDLKSQNYAWLWGECSANSQISPYGIFQEMILTFFNMPNFSNMSQEFLKQAKTMISETFPVLSSKDVFDLFNFLYPTLTSNFEDILLNRDRTFELLEKVILEISKKAKLIIVIDDFDMIDGSSYAFLSYFVEQGNLSENIKLIITYKDNRVTQGYFYSEKLSQNRYEDLRLTNLTIRDTDSLVKLFLNGKNVLPKQLFEKIYEYSEGNSAYIEQLIVLFNEYKSFVATEKGLTYRSTKLEEKLPKNIYQILSIRLHFLEKKYPKAYKTLCTAAIMGNKFNIKLLEIIMKFSPEEFENIVQLLSARAYIAQFNSNVFEFKNTLLWKFVYEKAKQGKDFVVLNEKIFDIVNVFTLSSNALKALIAQNLNQKLLALNIWTENIKLCAYLGDEHLWTLSQKQCLKIAQEVNPENNEVIINNIQERLGKLLYLTKPSEAIYYLSGAVANAIRLNNRPKVIELAGYLSKSCTLTGNYNGVIESIDTILNYVDYDSKLEIALIKQKKLKAMFSIGNAEEVYNIASNEIVPVIEQALSGIISNNGISMNVIYESWLECNLTVATALTSQGNKKAFDILALIDDIVEKNNVENQNYLQRVKLVKALAYSIQGQIGKSEELLIEFTQSTSKINVEPEIISKWNFINILNKIYKHDWTNIKEDLYSVVTFANNYNDVLSKNMLRVFLGRVLQEEGTLSRALDIFNEQVTVFAREKIAIGALLCWYFISKITLVTEGTDKAMDISMKALEVAKNPKISNYYFMVLYKQLLAEIFLIKGDMESCKMYIEKALLIAKQYDMRLLRVSLFRLYAKYLEEMVSKKPQNKSHYAQNAIETYKKVLALAEEIGIPDLKEDINKNYASFRAFCQLNSIAV